MKKTFIYITSLMLACAGMSGCQDILDKEVDLSLSDESVWSSTDNTRYFLANIYTYLPDAFEGFGFGDGGQNRAASHDCMTDNSSTYWNVHYYNTVQTGGITAKSIEGASDGGQRIMYWTNNFKGIRACNQYLKNARPEIVGADYIRSKTEVKLIRAILNFHLIENFGRVPLLGDAILDQSGAGSVVQKSPAEGLQWVVAQCDEIINGGSITEGSEEKCKLPFRYENENADWGRVNGATAYALKSRALLYLASPLYAGQKAGANNDAAWNAAAKAAEDFISANEALGARKYSLYSDSDKDNDYYNCFVTTPHLNNEYILSRSEWSTVDLERYLAPCGFKGLSASSVGRTNPTVNLVYAYEMSNGLPYDNEKSGYDAANPYANRDPRFEQSIFHMNTVWGRKTQDEMRAVDVSEGGTDWHETHGGTHTGFYSKKFCINIEWKTGGNNPRSCPIFRLAEIYLNAAEAYCEAGNLNKAMDMAQKVRERVGMPSWKAAYGRDLTKEELRERIQNERRVEFAFEDHRYYDERRWRLFDGQTPENELNLPYYKQVYNLYRHVVTAGTAFTGTGDITGGEKNQSVQMLNFTYSTDVYRQRAFTTAQDKSYWWPIPYSNTSAANPAISIQQNPGW